MNDTPETNSEKPGLKGPLPTSHSKPPLPVHMRLINLLVVGFLLYVVLNYFSGGGLEIPEYLGTKPEKSESVEAQLSSEDPRIDRLAVQESFNAFTDLIPNLRMQVATRTVSPGKGRQAFCGQQATYQLRESAKGKAGKPQTVVLGQAVSEKTGLAWGIQGMHLGEIREIRVPRDFNASRFSEKANKEATIYYAELLKLEPELPKAGPMALRRFISNGEAGLEFRCGDQAVAHLTLWSPNGQILFSSLNDLPIYFEIGAGKAIPYGLELGALEMGPGGSYTLIIPPELVKPLHANLPVETPPKELEVRSFPSDLALPDGQLLIADISFLKHPPLKTKKQTTKELPLPKVE